MSRFVIAFLPRGKRLSWLQSPSAVILEPKKIKSVTVSTFPPFTCHEVMWLDVMILVFWMVSFKPSFSVSSPSSRGSLVPLHFMPLKWYHLHIWGCWYFSWQSWFQLGIYPAWHFSLGSTFLMMYSAYKLNKQSDNIQSCHTLFPILNQSDAACPVPTVAFDLQTGLLGDR